MEDKRMSISEHLTELRSRLIVCLVAVVLGMIVAYYYCPEVFLPMIRAPLDAVEGARTANPFVLKTPVIDIVSRFRPQGYTSKLYVMSLTEAFLMRLKVALVVGIVLALPVIIYETWTFVAVGLHDHERRWACLYGPASLLLFAAGAGLAYFVVLPIGIVFLLRQGDAMDAETILRMKEYAPFVMWLLLAFGLIFQMPVVALLLTQTGVVTPEALARSRRHAILVMVILAAVLTPPDVFTQLAMALPMIALYEVSVILSRLTAAKREKTSTQG